MAERRQEEIVRFSVLNRLLHLFVMIGFAGLALTGFSLKFSSQTWAQAVAWILGGSCGIRSFHRIFAVLTYGCVVVHLLWLLYFRSALKGRLTGPDSLFPSLKDFRDLLEHVRYMFGRGKVPVFPRFSYWEKFDYWAILIGMNTMGATGLVLWFPEFFTSFFPGYILNVAQVLHLYEAIMAVALKFVVHIVTTHLRPEVFPLDRSIFNGRRRFERGRAGLIGILFFLTLSALGSGISEAEAVAVSPMPLTEEGRTRACLDCHRFPNVHTNEGAKSSQAFCLECHGSDSCTREDGTLLKVSIDSFGKGRHAHEACVMCHRDVARSPHKSQSGALCTHCHGVHGEGVAGDPHLRVQCQACHRKSLFVEYDSKKDLVILSHKDDKGVALALTDHSLPELRDRKSCTRCHKAGNKVGAASAILPGKSILCIFCHNAPATLGHWAFGAAMLVFLFGLSGMLLLWFKGRIEGEEQSFHKKISVVSERLWETIFSRGIFRIFSVFFLDVILQRRLLRESVRRWFSHSLIYYGFLGKFVLGLLSFIFFGLFPTAQLSTAMLDKNNWLQAILNDLFGGIILIGLAFAVIQRIMVRPAHVLSEEQDSVALILVGVIVAGGFLLEGARIVLTGIPADKAIYSFIGYPVSTILRSITKDWQGAYGYLWWFHGITWAVFFAYLPFGKLKHILTTPLTLLIREGGTIERR